MLPEILDSRHNRHMSIRDPKYIMEAKEEASKKIISRKRNRQNIESESIVQENKRLNVLQTEGVITAATSLDSEQDDDCVIVSYSNDNRELTEDDIARQKRILDDTIASLSSMRENVLPIHSKLNDESLDRFLRVVRETTLFETQSVLYLEFPHLIAASRSDKSLQIIGGNCSDHWRCIFFDGIQLHVYDSIPNCTYDKLVDKEKNYIHRRYPEISKTDIIFEKVQTQSDCTCCRIFAAAFATTIALGGNPCDEKYSKDVKCMRQHLIKIVEGNELLPFPK